ncbi:MAG: zinc-ribbon domain-containing protein [Roseburia sp.]|nr:zinc-ribbon domain-containing protein [Roseburia sp.]
MGLFSKKTLTCERCGKEYEARISIGSKLCPLCQQREKDAKKEVSGYVSYGEWIGRKYNEDELKAIAQHRDDILETHRNTRTVTREELKQAGDNYKKLSESEAVDIYERALYSLVAVDRGASYATKGFFCLTQYEGVVVAAEDVFAVAYCKDFRLVQSKDSANVEALLCVAFTNDPYIPVFPMVYFGKIGLFAMKSKSGRQGVEETFSRRCPNLLYPVMETKQLKKILKGEASKGSIDSQTMLKYLSDAEAGSRMFDSRNMVDTLPQESLDRLSAYGFIPWTEVSRLMKLEGMFSQSFWEKILEKVVVQYY